jgi:hypothetical protein
MYYKSEEIELKGDYKYVWSSKRGDVNIISVSLSRLLHVVVIHTHTHTHTKGGWYQPWGYPCSGGI